jgi:hypothetical protein
MRRIDGQLFTRAVRAGALAVVREQEELNRINVFPVRDADTGANLAATLRAAATRLGSAAAPLGIGDAARAAADGALDGARGNSGAIFAQFLHGLAAGIGLRDDLSPAEFAGAARSGAESAYRALADPREGTILSVLHAWAHELGDRARPDEDFIEMMRAGLAAAREALAQTPHQLEVLARSHVVDAGGQGFVYFLEGIVEALLGREHTWVPAVASPHGVPPFTEVHEEIDERFRYCTEALLVAPAEASLSRDTVLNAIAGLGESLVVAGGDQRLRVHIHTNEPQRFLAALAGIGAVEHSKVDDMVLQQLAGREASLAIVTDSTADLPEEDVFRLGVVAVPLTLSIGEDEYLDGVDLTLDAYVRRLQATSAVPRSSQPAVGDFVETYRRLLEYREGILSIHIAAAMSGTVQAAATAARQVDPRRIRVIDSCSVSVGAGLVVQAVGDAIADGADLDEAQAVAERVKRDVKVFGTVASLEFAVRGGRVSPRMARAIERLGLSPIIVFDETGKAGKGGVALGFDRALQAAIRRAVRWTDGRPACAMVVHSGDEAGAALCADRLRRRLGLDEVPVVRAGAVLTTHVGLGSVSMAVRRLPA